jgi:hypothetical protein
MPCSSVDIYTMNFGNLLLPASTLKVEEAYCSSRQQAALEHWQLPNYEASKYWRISSSVNGFHANKHTAESCPK